MNDNLQDRGERDRSRVNVNEEHELRYWTQEFGCTEEQLREAVRKVGGSVSDVRKAMTSPTKERF